MTRHGLGCLVGVFGLDRFVPFHRGLLGHPRRAEPYTRPEHVRMAIEELGATFIKLGQILSTRADLLPLQYQAELARLRDAADQASLDAAWLAVELPQQLLRIIGELERGGLEVGMRPTRFEPLVRRFERLGNRIVLGIIAAALINGLAVLMSVYHPAGWERWSGPIFAAGFAFALALGTFLFWSIFRSGQGD